MALCVMVTGSGEVVAVDPQPATTGDCALVLVSGAEANQSPFDLTPEQGGQIGGAVLLIWALAFVFRTLIRALSIDEVQGV